MRKKLQLEAKSFDQIVNQRIKKKFAPFVHLKLKNNFLYNNPWRFPESQKISIKSKTDFVLDNCKKNSKCLEIGCGLGTMSLELARNNHEVTGIDISSDSIKHAESFAKKYLNKKNRKKIEYKNISFGKYKTAKKFDRIIFFKSLHHLINTKKVLKKCFNLLNKNGKIIVVEPMRKNFKIENALIIYLIRRYLPTWKNNKKNYNTKNFSKDIRNIYNEYHYIDSINHTKSQSPYDNSLNDPKKLIKLIKKLFKIQKIYYTDSIQDKILGGLRGKNYIKNIHFINSLDKFLIDNKILNGTSIHLVAKKNEINS